jgi:hypothetical protein
MCLRHCVGIDKLMILLRIAVFESSDLIKWSSNPDDSEVYSIQHYLTIYEVRNPGPGLEHAQKCSEVKLVNEINVVRLNWSMRFQPLLITGSPTTKQM